MLFFTNHSMDEFCDIIIDGSDPAADNVIVDKSIITAVKNRLAWIHIHATNNQSKLFFSVFSIPSFHDEINHFSTMYTK